MRKHFLTSFLILLVFLQWIMAESMSYSLIRIRVLSDVQWARLLTTGIDLEGATRLQDGSIELVLNSNEVAGLRRKRFELLTIKQDMSEFFRSRLLAPAQGSFAIGNMSGYFTYTEVLDKLQEYHSRFPDIVGTPRQIGASVEGRPIIAVKVSDHPNIEEADEPEVLYIGLQHAREPAGMMALMYFFEQLTKAYHSNVREARYVVDHRQLWFIPVANPDGYVYNQQTNPAGGGLWRKNRRKNADGSFGVDLNRNYGYAWGYDDKGSSPDPKVETYRGTAPFSEPEAAAARDFVNQHKFSISINFHSYGGSLLFPWSYTYAESHYWAFIPLSDVISHHYWVGNSWSLLNYLSNGDSDDWLFGDRKLKPLTVAYTNEVGSRADNFWPERTRLLQIVRENYPIALSAAWSAGSYPHVVFYSQHEVTGDGNGILARGEVGKITASFRNTGLQPSQAILTRLVSKSPEVKVLISTATVSPMNKLGRTNSTVGQVSISPSAQVCRKYPLELQLYSADGTFLRKDLLTVVPVGPNGC